ncbi:hypothetical protein A3G67_00770 [Candidatus Roizmanbacteria bacterium RIFCSPLOWO2_12_FULL_40_12]|nr:MAG: hypothetical protein A3G67_00770 [Candidatus Roizmanbacteria bacterium RIFCSPLOWO2_12_FULL_40_12]
MNKVIVGALVFLILLIFISVLFTSFLGGRNQQGQGVSVTPIPTQQFESSGQKDFSASQQVVEKINKTFSSDELEQVDAFNKKLPFSSDSLDIGYSDALGQYFIQKKNPDADQELEEFLSENNMLDLKNDFDYLFVTTNTSVAAAILKAENDFIKSELDQSEESTESAAPKGKTDQEKNILLLTELTVALQNIGKKTDLAGAIANPTAIDEIFNEAGGKVGTPPKMLKAIMSIECGRLLGAPPQEIASYSAPGAGLPPSHFCYRNRGGYPAFGPMQFVPGTFARYGSSVNRLGGYTHRPNIQNIRDSVYAAAELFLLNSGATGGNWGPEQIKRAYVCYAAGCRQYDTGRLGADTQRLFAMFLERYNSY